VRLLAQPSTHLLAHAVRALSARHLIGTTRRKADTLMSSPPRLRDLVFVKFEKSSPGQSHTHKHQGCLLLPRVRGERSNRQHSLILTFRMSFDSIPLYSPGYFLQHTLDLSSSLQCLAYNIHHLRVVCLRYFHENKAFVPDMEFLMLGRGKRHAFTLSYSAHRPEHR
jgi:hypothetical protein